MTRNPTLSLTDATLSALFAVDEIARAPGDWRAEGNRPFGYEARSSIRPLPPRRAIGVAL